VYHKSKILNDLFLVCYSLIVFANFENIDWTLEYTEFVVFDNPSQGANSIGLLISVVAPVSVATN
jgi:hypothetical protein